MARKKDDGQTAAGNGGTNGGDEAGDASRNEKRVVYQVALVARTPHLMTKLDGDGILDIQRGVGAEKPKKGLSRDEVRAWNETHMVKPSLNFRLGPDGTPVYGIPAKNLIEALIKGGVHVTATGRRKFSTAKESIVPVLVEIIGEFLPFPESCQQYVTDLTHGWGMTGTFVAIARPRFDQWAIRPTFIFDTSEFPVSRFRELVEVTGRKVGLGAHRPAKKGKFGQFRIGSWEQVADVPETAVIADPAEFARSATWPTLAQP